jgi:hypothetical protein
MSQKRKSSKGRQLWFWFCFWGVAALSALVFGAKVSAAILVVGLLFLWFLGGTQLGGARFGNPVRLPRQRRRREEAARWRADAPPSSSVAEDDRGP